MSNIYSIKRNNDFDDFEGLDQLSALYKETKAGVKPPHELDTHIRTAAREALKPRRSVTPRWAGGLALAATLVLGIGLITLVQQEVPESIGDTSVAPSVDTASVPARSIKPETAGQSFAPAPKPAPPRTNQTYKPSGKTSSDNTDNQPLSEHIRIQRHQSRQRLSKSAEPAQARQAIPDTSLTIQQPLHDSIEPSAEIMPSSTVLEAPIASDLNETIITTTAVKAAAEPAKDQPIRGAKAWLDDIIELQKTGDNTEFEKQLAAFRKAYPDYLLPQSLSSH